MKIVKEEVREVATSTARIRLGSDNIVRVLFLRGGRITIDKLKENHKAYREVTGDRAYPFIFEAEENIHLEPDAQKFANQMSSDNMSAIAVVVKNFLYRLLAEYYYGQNKPPVPYKVFSQLDDAENWVKLYQ